MAQAPFLSEIPKPVNEQDFERLCAEVYRHVYKCKLPQLFGRRGQNQSGIDILLQSPSGSIGIQAKKRAKQLRTSEIVKDIEAADSAGLRLSQFLIVTTAPSDRQVVEWAWTLTEIRRNAGLFPVAVEFWEEVSAHIRRYPELRRFDVQAPGDFDEDSHKRNHDLATTRALFSKLNLPILDDHLQNFPYTHRYDVCVMYDGFIEVWKRPSMYIHDSQLKKCFAEFARSWERAMPQDGKHFFEDTSMPGIERFQSTGAQYRLGTFRVAPVAFKELKAAVAEMSRATQALLELVQGKFPELNLHKLGLPLGCELKAPMRELRGR